LALGTGAGSPVPKARLIALGGLAVMRKLALILSFAWALPVGASGSLGDMNGDGKVNLADCVYLLSYLFGGGTPPVPCASCWYGDLGRGDVNGDSKMSSDD